MNGVVTQESVWDRGVVASVNADAHAEMLRARPLSRRGGGGGGGCGCSSGGVGKNLALAGGVLLLGYGLARMAR